MIITLYLEGTTKNLEKARKVFLLFCIDPSAKMNSNKSFAIWASNNQRDCEWGHDKGLIWVPKRHGVKYSGFQI
jgi:hypothetical protein